MIEPHYCTIKGQQLHFLKAGKGAPIVLFHPSPSSSKSMIPFIKELAQHFQVIAIDTPGYGASDLMPHNPKSLKAYCKYLQPFFKKMGLTKFAIYGSATGAQLAIRYGLEFPKQVSHLYLDNAAHFSNELRDKIVASYFPDISPKYDGSHLMTIWTMVHDLFVFFPWCFSEEKYRVKKTIPPAAILHQIALEYMLAGENYDLAYRAAFYHEKAEYVQQLTPSTSIFHWEGSIVKPYIDDLVAHDLPNNVRVVKIPATPNVRFAMMKEHIVATYQSDLSDHKLKEHNIEKIIADTKETPSLDLPKLVPDDSGAYLIKAWHLLRDRQLFTSITEKTAANISKESFNLKADFLQKQLIEWMQQ